MEPHRLKVVVLIAKMVGINRDNIQLDSHVGGDIYKPMHPLRTFVAFRKLRKKNFNWKKETA